MLVSRGATALKLARFVTVNSMQPVRNSNIWNYRKPYLGKHPKIIEWAASGVGGIAWWWVLWHIWTEPGHILGEFDYPEPEKWTDEELGIPPK